MLCITGVCPKAVKYIQVHSHLCFILHVSVCSLAINYIDSEVDSTFTLYFYLFMLGNFYINNLKHTFYCTASYKINNNDICPVPKMYWSWLKSDWSCPSSSRVNKALLLMPLAQVWAMSKFIMSHKWNEQHYMSRSVIWLYIPYVHVWKCLTGLKCWVICIK